MTEQPPPDHGRALTATLPTSAEVARMTRAELIAECRRLQVRRAGGLTRARKGELVALVLRRAELLETARQQQDASPASAAEHAPEQSGSQHGGAIPGTVAEARNPQHAFAPDATASAELLHNDVLPSTPASSNTALNPSAETLVVLVALTVILMLFSIVCWKLGNQTMAASAGVFAIGLIGDIGRRLLGGSAANVGDPPAPPAAPEQNFTADPR